MNNYISEDEYKHIIQKFSHYCAGEDLKSMLKGLVWRLLKMPDTRGFTSIQIQGSNSGNSCV